MNKTPEQIAAMVPEHMSRGLLAYINHGQRPGGFLRAVLENQLLESFKKADLVNQLAMLQWASVLEHIPWMAWGSAEKVDAWITRGGLTGSTLETPDQIIDS